VIPRDVISITTVGNSLTRREQKGQNLSAHVKFIFRELKSKSSQISNSDRLIFLKRERFGKCARKSVGKLKNSSPNKDAKNEETATCTICDTPFSKSNLEKSGLNVQAARSAHIYIVLD
jgi:hypothetical protein